MHRYAGIRKRIFVFGGIFTLFSGEASEIVGYFFDWLIAAVPSPLSESTLAADFTYFSLGSAPGKAAVAKSKFKCGSLTV